MTVRSLSCLTLVASMLLVPGMATAALTITSGPNYGNWSIGEIQAQLTATGGSGGYSWSVVSGSLPPGLAIRTDIPPFFSAGATAGLIGVATPPQNSPTTYNFTLKVTSNGQSTTMASSITISSLTSMDLYTLPDAFVNTAYTYTLTALNNAGPVTWTLNNGTWPPGMNLTFGRRAIGYTDRCRQLQLEYGIDRRILYDISRLPAERVRRADHIAGYLEECHSERPLLGYGYRYRPSRMLYLFVAAQQFFTERSKHRSQLGSHIRNCYGWTRRLELRDHRDSRGCVLHQADGD